MSVLQLQETESERELHRATPGHPNGDRMIEQDLSHNWFAVCTRHQHEKTAARNLEYKEFEVFLPLYKARHRWKDRIKEVSLPLFPGYLFVREGSKRWLAVLTTPGVSSIVSCGGQPAAIPFAEIEGLKRVVDSTLGVEPHPFLKSGDWVRVKYGPIAGVEGILLRKKNVARLVLSVEMLGKSAAVEVDATDVERIPAGALRTDLSLQSNFIVVRTDVRQSSYTP
jgi:transcription antitermination factor NusG